MGEWQFWETEKDGAAWLEDPKERHAVVTYAATTAGGRSVRRRIMVVSQAWVAREMKKLGPHPLAATLVLPSVIVLRDGNSRELRQQLNRALADGGALLDSIATEVES
ncbi:MAG: hypothetical protein ACRDHF_00200 [Tepidiformaceae bacterium]